MRRDVAVLLGRIHQERDEWPQARYSFQRALDLNKEQSPGDAIRELDVLTNLAKVLRSADEEDELARLRPSIEQLAASIQTFHEQRQMKPDEYHYSVRIFIDYVTDTHTELEAIDLLGALLRKSSDPRDSKKMQLKIADMYAEIDQFTDELRVLLDVLRAENMAVQNQSFTVNQLARIADLYRRIANALDDIGESRDAVNYVNEHPKLYTATVSALSMSADGVPGQQQDGVDRRHEPDASDFERLTIAYLEKSRQLYENILPRIASERAEDEWVPLELTVLQTLQNVTYQLYVNGHRSNAEVIAAAKRLLNRLDETALKTDRRVFEAKTLLGSVHLRDKNLDAAKSSLTDARMYWENRTPPDHTLTVQTLMLLAQVERANGSSLAARELLKRSLEICTNDLSDDTDLLVSLNIQLGRLLAASQSRDEAENHFVEAIRLAREAADPISELTCNIELANIAISQGSISQENIIRVQQILAESTGICAQHLSEDDSMTLQVRHQQALFHVLRDRTQANPQDRETARRLWKNILIVQEEQKHSPDQQARTLHYLARLSYRDWSKGLELWRTKRQATLLGKTTYVQRRDEYNERFKVYEKDLSDYRQAKSKFHESLRTHNSDNARRDGQQTAKLQTTRQTLLHKKRGLDIERAALVTLKPIIRSEYVAASASARETSGKFKEDLDQMLTVADRLASRAYDLHVDVANSDATLGEQIRSSFEEIHKRKLEWDEAEKRILNPSVVKKMN